MPNINQLSIDDGSSFESGYDRPADRPAPVGYWRITDRFSAPASKRPSELNLLMTQLLLGWEWVDG